MGKPKVENFQFKAEVTKVLDIVINSLYTDKEIFVRELISNAVDALEKMRHLNLTDTRVGDREKDLPLEIKIELDKDKKTFAITDSGIGLTREELIENLGSVAHSGARDFLSQLADQAKKDINLIGQFGVGFYSAFMAAKKVTVLTRSYGEESTGYIWMSDGSTGYTIQQQDGLARGTKIVLDLKDETAEYAENFRIKNVITQYSNFVPFPIEMDGETVNTMQAIWTRSRDEITEEEYKAFYKFIAGLSIEPMDWLHFVTDAPLSIHALLFIPTENMERFGMGKLDPNVDLHCRKVLIQKQAKDILPPWLRFLHGVIDSDDLPLNISRETMQDSALVRKMNKAITGRFIKFLEDQAKQDSEKYTSFWKTFGSFIKEGIITDFEHRQKLARLLRFETSRSKSGEWVSMDQYLDGMSKEQTSIYFINGSSREAIEAGPYLEVFRKRDIEVIYNYEPVDDFVMMHLKEYQDKTIVSAETEKLDLPEAEKSDTETASEEKMDAKEIQSFSDWLRKVLQEKVTEVRESNRLVSSPVILVNPDGGQITGAMERLLHAMQEDNQTVMKRALEFNPSHPLIRKLAALKDKDEAFAETVVFQIYDQAALSAGLAVETRELVTRIYDILDRTLNE